MIGVAGGEIRDKKSDNKEDNYGFQYYFTVIAWNRFRIDARAAVNPKNGDSVGDRTTFEKKTAITYVASYVQRSCGHPFTSAGFIGLGAPERQRLPTISTTCRGVKSPVDNGSVISIIGFRVTPIMVQFIS